MALAYDALTLGKGRKASDGISAIQAAYDAGETDEFILPTICTQDGLIKDGDGVILFNFRPDRAREITRTLVDVNFDGFQREKTIHNLSYICMTQYDEKMPNVQVAFPPQKLNNTLGEYISGLGLHQLRIAETEKYAHVTFFFNGGVEEPNPLEDRILIPSPQVATYDLQVKDASQNATVAAKLMNPKTKEELEEELHEKYRQLCEKNREKQVTTLSLIHI